MNNTEPDITYSLEEPAHFICPADVVQQFIDHLNAQKIIVQPPSPAFEQGGSTFCELQLVTPLDQATADELIATFGE
jgi:hypothetical protein